MDVMKRVIALGISVLFVAVARADETRAVGGCNLPGLASPDLLVFGIDEYGGRELEWQIDQSGSDADQIDVEVNLPGKSVALVLRGYEPIIWNIGYTKGTKIVGVSAYGYNRQVIAGLPASVPRLTSAIEEDDRCGRTPKGKKQHLNQIATEVFGTALHRKVRAKDGIAKIGPPSGDGLIRSPDATPESYLDKSQPLAGRTGLKDAVRKGLLRPATEKDLAEWDGMDDGNGNPIRSGDAYVVLGAFELPPGTNGTVLLVPSGVPEPTGDIRRSNIFYVETKRCVGFHPLCGGTPWRDE